MRKILVIQKQKYEFIDFPIEMLKGKCHIHSVFDPKHLPGILKNLKFDLIMIDSQFQISVIEDIYDTIEETALFIFNPENCSEKKGLDGYILSAESGNIIKVPLSGKIDQILERIISGKHQIQYIDDVKSEILANVSHELRTPLAIIKESVGVVCDKLIGEINDAQQHFLNISLRNVERLTNIINRLLEMSGIDKEDVKVNFHNVNLRLVMNNVYEEIKWKAEEKSVSIEYEIDDNVPEIISDGQKIKQILTNIMENAVKFSNHAGTIYFGAYRTSGYVEIYVKDTGEGIPEKEIPKIFDKFHQVKRTAGPGERGTGLGLSISKKLVEMLNGTVQVESKIGNGTTFVVSLPVKTEKIAHISKKEI